ncbi:MAG: hypothetical protein Q8O05_05900 [Chloroflexota bacterium]|nr:hypothetical protein [Chloroflexota bacterium]
MTLVWFRDLVISISGLVFIGVLILYAVLAYRFYRRVRPLLELMRAASETVQGLSAFLTGLVTMVRGVSSGANAAYNLFKGKGGKQK